MDKYDEDLTLATPLANHVALIWAPRQKGVTLEAACTFLATKEILLVSYCVSDLKAVFQFAW